CANLYFSLGVKEENLLMLDSKGVITTKRSDLNAQKQAFARDTDKNTLPEAIRGADVFVGLSKGNIVNQEMVKSMAANPIVFALANPDPEIPYKEAIAARKDIIMATGRSDHPNMVNNVLGFPYIFRGALDVRATCINDEMKLAAVRAIADLAREPVPEVVNLAYNQRDLAFGKEYIIPKPFDPRLIAKLAPAIAKAAIDTGVAQYPITDWKAYKEVLISRLGRDDKFIRLAMQKAKVDPRKIVFTDGESYKVLKAAQILADDGIAHPIVLGRKKSINAIVEKYSLTLDGIEIRDIEHDQAKLEIYTESFYEARKRKGLTKYEAKKHMRTRGYYGSMMVKHGEADAVLTGLALKYPSAIKPILNVMSRETGVHQAAGIYILLTKNGPLVLADTTMNTDPTIEDIVEITISAAEAVKRMSIEPKIALLSYSNFGSHKGTTPSKMNKATAIIKERRPDLIVDGEMQANFAMNNHLLKEVFPFSELVDNKPNVLIFPGLASGNIAYKLLQSNGVGEAIGPILIGLDKSAHVLQIGSSVREIVNMATIAVVDAQTRV
ncbi:MAG: phosphate acyltransferase, partial [Bacteroidota bacterium]